MGAAMELRHLRYFLVVGELLSFTRAAAQLRIAQPALSRQVPALEDEIGVDLLKRSPRGVTLNAGRAVCDHTTYILLSSVVASLKLELRRNLICCLMRCL
jgi:DNA-binding transcriptional LysR family regulator